MRHTIKQPWKAAVVGGLVLAIGVVLPFDFGAGANQQSAFGAQKGGGGGGKGGGGGGGGGGRSEGGGGGGRAGGGGGGGGQVRSGGGGGGGGGQVRGGSGGQQIQGAPHPGGGQRAPSVNRTPSFSQPRMQTPAPRATAPRTGGSAGVRTDTTLRPDRSTRIQGNVAPNTTTRRTPGATDRTTNRIGTTDRTARRVGTDSGRTANLATNTEIRLGNSRVNLAPAGYQPAYSRHRFYHGYWNNNYAGTRWGYGGRGWWGGNYGWGDPYWGPYGYGFGVGFGYGYWPVGWGWGSWGLGSFAYRSGYLGYYNPYWIDGSYTGFSYAQPIPVIYQQRDVSPSAEILDAAIAAFKNNDYDAALDIVNKGVAQFPEDSVMHEFRALVLFARQDYQQAAATVHSVLAVGPGWDWTTLSSLYVDVGIYTAQLRALEAFTRENPDDAGSRFLLAYHYMSDGYPDAAATQLEHVVRLKPDDRVARDVLKMVSPPPQTAESTAIPRVTQPGTKPPPETEPRPAVPAPEVPAEAGPPPKPIDQAKIIGDWKASRADGSQFELTLAEDKTFRWKFAPKGQKPEEFTGTYTVEGNVLALENKERGSLIAAVTQDAAGKFNFKLMGAPPEDPGLNFSK